MPDARLIQDDGWDAWVPQGTWVRKARHVSSYDIELPEFSIRVHPHDLLGEQLKISGFGCCGYFPGRGANLHCRCGAPVGLFVDECSCRIQCRLLPGWGASRFDRPQPGASTSLGTTVRDEAILLRIDRAVRAQPVHDNTIPETQWDNHPHLGRVSRPTEIAFMFDSGPRGLVVRLQTSERVTTLRLPPAEIVRAIALRRLPIGNSWLSLSYKVLDRHNQTVLSWALTRFGDEVELLEQSPDESYAYLVWEEWLQYRWAEAVDRWI